MCSEFQLIHELCLYALSASLRPELIRATLSALHAYLSWMPIKYIFESPLVIYLEYKWNKKGLKSLTDFDNCYWTHYSQLETLLKFFPVPEYRNLTLQCLTKVCRFIGWSRFCWCLYFAVISNELCSCGRLQLLIMIGSTETNMSKCTWFSWNTCR